MSDETLTWSEADKAEAFDAIVEAACTCGPGGLGLCSVCDVLVYGGDLVKAVVGDRDHNTESWRKRAQTAEAELGKERAQAKLRALGYWQK